MLLPANHLSPGSVEEVSGSVSMVAHWQKPVWLVVACAAFVAQVAPQARSGDCDRSCCAAQGSDCCAVAFVPPPSANRVEPADTATNCPLCAAPVSGGPAHAAESPCHCQLDARQDQSLAVHDARPSQRDDLPVWGEVADSTSLGASHGLGGSRTYVVASRSIPIRPVRILYGVWRN